MQQRFVYTGSGTMNLPIVSDLFNSIAVLVFIQASNDFATFNKQNVGCIKDLDFAHGKRCKAKLIAFSVFYVFEYKTKRIELENLGAIVSRATPVVLPSG